MGLFANMKSAKVWKTGKKYAEIGNYDKALVYFDDGECQRCSATWDL